MAPPLQYTLIMPEDLAGARCSPAKDRLTVCPAETPGQQVQQPSHIHVQVETLVMMARAFGRTLVMPDHLAGAMDHMGGPDAPRFDQFFDFVDLRRWTPVMSMDEYLTVRCLSDCLHAGRRASSPICMATMMPMLSSCDLTSRPITSSRCM